MSAIICVIRALYVQWLYALCTICVSITAFINTNLKLIIILFIPAAMKWILLCF